MKLFALKLQVQTAGAIDILETGKGASRKGWDTNICSPAILHRVSQPRINLTLLSFKYLSLGIPYPIKHQPHKIIVPSHLPLMYLSSFPFPFLSIKMHYSQVWQYLLSLWAPLGQLFAQCINLFIFICPNIYIFQLVSIMQHTTGKGPSMKITVCGLISLHRQDSGFNQLILVRE